MNKTFCILEQGKFVNEALTIKHKEQFTTSFSDFYRLNWYTDNDPNANFFAEKITLSEGKNLLYEKVPKIYKYYIFIDDDIILETVDNTSVAEKIRDILDMYNPLHGTFYRKKGSVLGSWHVARLTKLHEQHKREAWPIYGFDLDCDIYHWSYIQAVFPIKYHGCYRCLGYTQYICYKLHQNKQLIFDQVKLTNTRASNHKDELNLPQANDSKTVTELFLKDLIKNELNRDSSFILDTYMIPEINEMIYLNEINKQEVIFSVDELKLIIKNYYLIFNN